MTRLRGCAGGTSAQANTGAGAFWPAEVSTCLPLGTGNTRAGWRTAAGAACSRCAVDGLRGAAAVVVLLLLLRRLFFLLLLRVRHDEGLWWGWGVGWGDVRVCERGVRAAGAAAG